MDTISVLSGLSKALKDFDGSTITYLCRKREDPAFSPVSLDMPWVRNGLLPENVCAYGIRSMTVKNVEGLDMDAAQKGNRSILFEHSRTISFDDWALVPNASDLWASFLREIIKPLKRADFEFIFYLGDTRKKRFFQIDEFLDIISDFSRYGRVTFSLDQNEALDLSKLLSGIDAGQDLTNLLNDGVIKEFRSIFLTMKIGQLLVYSADQALLLSNGPTLTLQRKPVDVKVERSDNARDNYLAGFSIGLEMQLELLYCIALGLTVFAIAGEGAVTQSREAMLAYIDEWIAHL